MWVSVRHTRFVIGSQGAVPKRCPKQPVKTHKVHNAHHGQLASFQATKVFPGSCHCRQKLAIIMFGGGRARTKKEARAHQDVESPVARHVAAVEGACVARHEKPPDRQAKHRRWSVPRAIDEATAYLERYLLNCWQLLRNSHLSQYFPAIVIFRLVLRGVYVLLLAPLKKCDDSMYRWECAQRENMYEHEPTSSFGKLVCAVFVDRDGWASAFYADMLLEIIFMAAVCGANNASVKSRQRNRCQLRRWHWLVAAAASLFVAVARDARLTYWNHERPLDATAKSRSIVHVIGCAIILICDALLVACRWPASLALAIAPCCGTRWQRGPRRWSASRRETQAASSASSP